jgi:hypothetical protein
MDRTLVSKRSFKPKLSNGKKTLLLCALVSETAPLEDAAGPTSHRVKGADNRVYV